MQNVEDIVVPEMPVTVPDEVRYIYVPIASYDNEGIASFDENYFTIENGKVFMKPSFLASIESIQASLNNKLTKITSKDKLRCYGIDEEGNQVVFAISLDAVGDSLVIRDENGYTMFLEAIEDNHPIIKSQFDELKESTSKDIAALKTGKADLKDGKVPAEQLPSYVDDVIDGKYVSDTKFTDSEGEALVAEFGKIYVDTDTGDFYRWSGSVYIKVSTANLAAIVQTLIERCAENTKNKLDKVTSNGSLRAYGVDNEGNQTVISTTTSGEKNALLLTDENGNSSVADPTEDTHIANKKFVDKENVKQNNIFANALKGEASGEMVLLTEVSPIEHEVKVKLRSKNLLPTNDYYYPGLTVTRAGVTFTVNDDLSIHVKGSSTNAGDSWFSFTNFRAFAIDCSAGTYTVSSKVDGTVINTDGMLIVQGNFIKSDETEVNCDISYNANGSKNKIVTIDQPSKFAGSIYVSPGIEVDCTVYLQLEKGTTATEYTPYVPDDATVTLTTCGKNLVSFLDVADKEDSGITFDVQEDGRVLINGTNNAGNYARLYANHKTLLPVFNADGTRKSIFPWEEHNYGLKISDATGDYYSKIDMYVEPSGTACIRVASGTTVDNYLYEPQIEINPTHKSTEYEPYKPGETITTTLAEGAVLKNIYPNMSIIPDIEGVVVDVEYIKDSNMVIEKLTQAIIALGGNI